MLAARQSPRTFDWINLLDASVTRYFSADTDKALLVLGRSEGRWRRGEPVEFTLAAQLVHQDEVMDVSTLDYGIGAARVRVVSPGAEAGLRWALARDWRVIAQLQERWNDFRAPLDDLWEHGGSLRLERDFGRWGALGLGYRGLWRDFRDRPQAAIGGRELPGTHLASAQHGGELHYRIAGGKALPWSIRLRADQLENTDNGTGWYDYTRRGLAGLLSFGGHGWRAEIDLDWRDYAYRWQTSGFGLDPPRKQRRELTALVRLERELGETWSVFLSAEIDRSRSNDAYLHFNVSTLSAGVRWSR
jgi:hypothetical protein